MSCVAQQQLVMKCTVRRTTPSYKSWAQMPMLCFQAEASEPSDFEEDFEDELQGADEGSDEDSLLDDESGMWLLLL